ncbi:MAG: PAS domain-containing protein, partial [Rhodospirillaceae bacterium]|nr:PAS domain-containing protein [Rhodospirillaceae bacterium]
MPYSDGKYLGTGLPYLELVPMEAPEMPLACALAAYYEEKMSAAQGLPFWRDFKLPELARSGLAKHVFVLEPVEGNTDWRYRLLGTEIVARFSIDRTGETLRDFNDPEHVEHLIQISNEIAASGRPRYFRLKPHNMDLQHLQIETMSLPIRNNT